MMTLTASQLRRNRTRLRRAAQGYRFYFRGPLTKWTEIGVLLWYANRQIMKYKAGIQYKDCFQIAKVGAE